MKNPEWRPRLSIEITQEQYSKLQKLIPWGLKGSLFSAIIDDLVEALETNGAMVISALVSRKLKLSDISNIFKDED